MWNDCETNSDFIDYQHYVNAVVKIIDNEELLPCSIGVFGDWRSGKSSLMKMVEEKKIDVFKVSSTALKYGLSYRNKKDKPAIAKKGSHLWAD